MVGFYAPSSFSMEGPFMKFSEGDLVRPNAKYRNGENGTVKKPSRFGPLVNGQVGQLYIVEFAGGALSEMIENELEAREPDKDPQTDWPELLALIDDIHEWLDEPFEVELDL